jgi:hypothetical protein
MDTLVMTVKFPPHQSERLFELLDLVAPGQKHISLTKWQKLLGGLRSVVLGITGGRGLLSILKEVLVHLCDSDNQLRLTHAVHGVLQGLWWLASDLVRRSTRISELVPTRQPATLGAHDAANPCMGGVHFGPIPDGTIEPLLWRSPFPPKIQSKLVSITNPKGAIINSDLELATSVTTHGILAYWHKQLTSMSPPFVISLAIW